MTAMKPPAGLFALVAVLMTLPPSLHAQPADPAGPNPREWWQGPRPRWPAPDPQAKTLPLIRVQGNRFVDPAGNTVLFRGLSIADPDKLESEGHWNRKLFEHARDMGATLVRIPVHPIAWRLRTPPAYLELLDQAVTWCTELRMHVIIDWHSIGNLELEVFQSPMYDTSRAETYNFWRTIARHFHGHNTVAFYELFNEPTSYRGQLGPVSWTEWREINENIISLVRSFDTETVPLVAGFDWAYDLTPLIEAPIRAPGIGYVTHPYANKRPPPWGPKWQEDFGFAAKAYPLIATEIGFNLPDGQTVDDEHYGNQITRYLESHGISWMAWVFDPEWGPRMVKSWDPFELTGGGAFFQMAMHRDPAPPAP
jgi:endoglucanase